MSNTLFSFAGYWWLYLAFTGLVAVLLAIDLAYHRKDRAISIRAAAAWTAIWLALALAFSFALYLFASAKHSPGIGRQMSLEFLAGYVVEESLSIDNMFVFALVFRYFAVPSRFQHRILFYGVLGAMIFRAIFIAVGATLIRFDWIMILFGLFLVFTGIRMAIEKEKRIAPGDSPVVRWICRFFPVTRELYGSRFFVTLGGIRHVTPLMVVLLFLETTDVMFAVDSVPAVFGVTREPFVVYTSNVFAVLGLRAMFFLLSGALERFHILKHGLAVVLVFVGLKMIWLDHLFGGRFSIVASLAIISAVIAASIILSLVFPKSVKLRSPLQPSRYRKVPQRVVGGVFLLLATASALYATGLGGPALPLPALNQAGAGSLFLSTAAYTVSKAAAAPLWARLQSQVSAKHSTPGSPVEAVVVQPYNGPAGLFIPMGARLAGRVLATSSKRPSSLRFSFESIWVLGRNFPLKTRLVEVDNARERVASDGTIVGLDLLRKRPGTIELLLLAAAYGQPEVMVFIEATKFALREFEQPDVYFPAGTDVALAIEEYPKMDPSAGPEVDELVASERLARFFAGLRERTRAKHSMMPSDWINLAFIGTRQSLDHAFGAAGWQTADRLSLRADVRTFFAVAEHHAYEAAPVSTLLVWGRQPDLVYQKQTNTFAKRHHIRIWSTGEIWDGQAVWIAAATHDFGIDFSKKARTFTHRVDSDVDLERTKVVSDLRFTGSVFTVLFVARPSVPATSRNATGDQIRTDGRLAVLAIPPSACAAHQARNGASSGILGSLAGPAPVPQACEGRMPFKKSPGGL